MVGAWGMGRKRIVWLRHARMLVCGEVFQGFSDGLSLRDGVRSPFFRVFDTPTFPVFARVRVLFRHARFAWNGIVL